jgi:hypothetical protein
MNWGGEGSRKGGSGGGAEKVCGGGGAGVPSVGQCHKHNSSKQGCNAQG